jgi:hypothetical protein
MHHRRLSAVMALVFKTQPFSVAHQSTIKPKFGALI